MRDTPSDAPPPDLAAALKDLAECPTEADEEGYEQPSGTAMRTAERLLRAMYEIEPQRFEVYPTEDREVTVAAFCPKPRRGSALACCDSEGGVLYLVHHDNHSRRAAYDKAAAAHLPDGFIHKALRDIAGKRENANR